MEFIQDLLFAVISAAVPVITIHVCKFLYAKRNEIEVKIDNDNIAKILDTVFDVVNRCVINTNQTFVDSLKASGSFTEEAAKEAFNKSKDTALKMLSEEALNIIKVIYGDVDVYLDTLIESMVNENKR